MAMAGQDFDRSGADRIIAGQGTSEQAWRNWPGLMAIPEVDVTALVPTGRRAVILAPHPDDELLGAGGLIALLLASDAKGSLPTHASASAERVLIIAVTDGTGSHPDSPLWPPERLGRVRPEETQAALTCLLSTNTDADTDADMPEQRRPALPPVLRAGLPDGGVTPAEDTLFDLLIAQLRPDDVLFASWRFDGHPDHEAAGRAAARAAEATGATLIEMPIWAWHWASPGDPRLPWAQACRLPLPNAVVEAKRAAALAYPSQLTPDSSTGAAAILPPFVLARVLREFEVFFLSPVTGDQ